MADEIAAIDASCIDALKQLKDEQDVLDQRIQAMDEMKSTVAEAVYLRVRADYVAKRNGLEDQSRPLRDTARVQYAHLMQIIGELEAAHETVKLDQQEIELRHQLGEFGKKEFESRMGAIAQVAAEKGAAHEQARTLRERFLGAVRSEDELRNATPPRPAAPLPPPVSVHTTAEVPQAAPPRVDVTAEIPKVPAARPAAAPAAPAAPFEGTMVMPVPNFAAPPPPARPAPAVNEATVMFRPARLVPQNPEAGKATHALTLKPISIGADAANEIRIGGPGVEPRHAQIVPTPKGYSLIDMDTKHGTRVNAEKVKERVLANEDVVQVGAARFVFRTS